MRTPCAAGVKGQIQLRGRRVYIYRAGPRAGLELDWPQRIFNGQSSWQRSWREGKDGWPPSRRRRSCVFHGEPILRKWLGERCAIKILRLWHTAHCETSVANMNRGCSSCKPCDLPIPLYVLLANMSRSCSSCKACDLPIPLYVLLAVA